MMCIQISGVCSSFNAATYLPSYIFVDCYKVYEGHFQPLVLKQHYILEEVRDLSLSVLLGQTLHNFTRL